MNISTKKKLDRIIEKIKNGSTEDDILKTEFNRSKKNMNKWINKNCPNLFQIEENEIVKHKEVISNVPMKALELLESHEERLKVLEDLIKDKSLRKDVTTDMLIIDETILRMKSEVKTIRINKDLFNEFNELIADKYINYSKTNIWNDMIKQYIEKYKN